MLIILCFSPIPIISYAIIKVMDNVYFTIPKYISESFRNICDRVGAKRESLRLLHIHAKLLHQHKNGVCTDKDIRREIYKVSRDTDVVSKFETMYKTAFTWGKDPMGNVRLKSLRKRSNGWVVRLRDKGAIDDFHLFRLFIIANTIIWYKDGISYNTLVVLTGYSKPTVVKLVKKACNVFGLVKQNNYILTNKGVNIYSNKHVSLGRKNGEGYRIRNTYRGRVPLTSSKLLPDSGHFKRSAAFYYPLCELKDLLIDTSLTFPSPSDDSELELDYRALDDWISHPDHMKILNKKIRKIKRRRVFFHAN